MRLAIALLLFHFALHAQSGDQLRNGCPNQDMVGKWNVSVDWSCSGRDSDTGSFNLKPDGLAEGGMKGNDGKMGTWACTSDLKLIVVFDDMQFTSFNYSMTSMMGVVRWNGQDGCWIASHDLSTVPPPSLRRGSRPSSLPPFVGNIPPQQYASPTGRDN